MSDELPQGWASAPFMDVFDIQGGTQPPKSTFKYEPTNGYVRLLQIRDFGEKPLPTFIPSKHTLKTCQKDDILIGRYGASIGRICTGMEGAYNVALAKVIIPEQIDHRFVFYVLRSPFFQRPILDIERSAQDGFNKEDLAEIILPLAPLAEQRRIVAKLEKLLGQVDACQQRLEKMPTLLKRFRQSILAAACSGRLTADWREENDISIENWRDAELRDICSSISDGDHLPPPQQPNGIPFLTIGNISSGYLDFSQTRFVSESYFAKIKSDRIPKRGDTLYTVVGASIGVPVMVETEQPFCFQRHIAILKPSKETDPKFLRALMGSPAVFREGWARTTGSAQPTLPLGNLRTIPVSIPSLAEQQEIVRRVVGLFALADQLEQRLTQARGLVAKLTPSLLARAFAGKLVPQDANDEPASVLLEHIRVQRVQPAKEKVIKVDFAKSPASQPQFNLGIPPLSDANIFEQRAALNAYVLSRRLHDKKLGRTIMEKHDELFEYDCGLSLLRERMRDAAGPVDFISRLKVEEKAKELDWFSIVEHKISGGKTFIEYLPGKNFSDAVAIAEQFIGDKRQAVDRIIKLLKPLSTDDCSIIGTLYAAWNDLLIFQKPISDDLVINESRNNWHPAKKGIPLSDWRRGLDWLRTNNVIPTGRGKPTIRKSTK